MNTALGINFTKFGSNWLEAEMPVDERTVQPLGRLNGGASLALVETVGSMAANLALDRSRFVAVGQQVSGNHFKPAFMGNKVIARATPLHIGKRSQVWEVLIHTPATELICKASITMAVIPIENHG